MIKKIFDQIKTNWYVLPKWQRHAGGSAVLVMCFAGLSQLWGPVDFMFGAIASLMFGVFKEGLENNTFETMMKDIALNLAGIIFTLLVLRILGNQI